MSRTSIELTSPQPPAAIATSSTSARRTYSRSTQSRATTTTRANVLSDNGEDDYSLHSLERAADTATSKSKTAVIIASVTMITTISSLLSGLTTVALPTIAIELSIPQSLLLWPSSIQALTSGCSLLISGSLADALGPRFMYLVGCVLQAGFVLGCGLSRTSAELIVFRGLSGIAISFCLPSAVAIITRSFVGQRRNVAFASMGGGQPIGFAIGLAVGGVLTDTIGWRWGFYISAVLDALLCAVAIWGLPASIDSPIGSTGPGDTGWDTKLRQLKTDIDWVGAIVASLSLAMLSYVFALVWKCFLDVYFPKLTLYRSITGSTASIRQPTSIALLIVALALIPVFIYWVGRQERLGKPAIIPVRNHLSQTPILSPPTNTHPQNSLWRNRHFTTTVLACFLTWGSFNATETILSFFFQRVQNLTAIQSSLRYLPAPIAGALTNVLIGAIVHKVNANWLVLGGCTLSAAAPLIMAFAKADSNYWSTAFLANTFNPAGADALFTIANLLITSVFPAKTQALAGGVFNTVSQIGKSVGLALVAVIAASVTEQSDFSDKSAPEALLEGYTASFWFCFGLVGATIGISAWGLRRVGNVGHKRD